MSLFYSLDIEKTLALNEEESAHAIRVLRLHTDDLITIIDGKGNFFRQKLQMHIQNIVESVCLKNTLTGIYVITTFTLP